MPPEQFICSIYHTFIIDSMYYTSLGLQSSTLGSIAYSSYSASGNFYDGNIFDGFLDVGAAGLNFIGAKGVGTGLNKLSFGGGLGRIDGSYSFVNPGGLSDNLAETFSGGVYDVITLKADTVLYRAGTKDQPLGQFFSQEKPMSALQTRIDKAVLPVWPGGAKSPIDSFFEVRIPKGTQVYSGNVGSQSKAFVGGTEQIVVVKPWEIDGVKVLNSGKLQ